MEKLLKPRFTSSSYLGTRVFIERNLISGISSLLDKNMEVFISIVNYARLKDLEVVTCNKSGKVWIEGLLLALVPSHLRVTPDEVELFTKAKLFSGTVNPSDEAIIYMGKLRILR